MLKYKMLEWGSEVFRLDGFINNSILEAMPVSCGSVVSGQVVVLNGVQGRKKLGLCVREIGLLYLLDVRHKI